MRTPDDLDQSEFDISAEYTATMIERHGFCYTALMPRDGTKYEISIVSPPTVWHHDRYNFFMKEGEPLTFQQRFSGSYFVSTQFGRLYRWEGQPLGDWSYVHEKWTAGRKGTDEWTAQVLFRFLNTLAPLLPEKPRREARID